MASAKPTITVIPASIGINAMNPLVAVRKRRVAAYARVSTDSDEQLSSYEAQVDFYTKHIKSNPEWEFAGVYADEAVSGVMTKGRDDFNRMVEDALDGKIDLIITKSVPRFARNTVDSLVTIRKLKEKGVEVYFELENIYTLDSKGELLITIMSSLAQDQSRTISENVTWGQRKRMADGKVNMPYKRFLGYAKGEDGLPEIVETEAAIIREIYAMFLGGGTYREIAAHLTKRGVPTPGGKAVWNVSTVRSILSNEKYAGQAVLQKKFTVDFLTKKTKVNEGEVPQYFVENSHPAIITPATFELAQDEIRRRMAIGKHLSGSGPFACKVVCGDCGGFFGSKVWNSNSEHRRMIWQCNQKYRNEVTCQTPHLTEDTLNSAFVTAFNRLLENKERYVAEYAAKAAELADTVVFDEQTARLEMECAEMVAQAQESIRQNAANAQDQEWFVKQHDELVARYDAAKSRIETAKREKLECVARKEKIRRVMAVLQDSTNPLIAFDDRLWQETVESMIIGSASEITVVFKSGTEIRLEGGAHSR